LSSYKKSCNKLTNIILFNQQELMAINLAPKNIGTPRACQFIGHPQTVLAARIERSVYQHSKRNLFDDQVQLRLKLAKSFNGFEDYFMVNSMPLAGGK
jgi:hypothetical protein